MATPVPELHDVVITWVRNSAALQVRYRHTPGPSRLVRRCLLPLVHELVSPTPTQTFAQRVCQLLDAAQESLAADLESASCEVTQILADVSAGAPIHHLLNADDIHDRVASTLRELARPEWERITDVDGAPLEKANPVWVEPHPELAADCALVAGLRMCKVWAKAAGALNAQDFALNWSPTIQAMIAAAPQTASSVVAGLGDLETPDLVVDPVEPRDWRLATDRSFHNRVRMYWDGKHVPGTWPNGDAGARLPQERFLDCAAPGGAMIRESATRTLSPFGLGMPAHQLLASALASAIGTATCDPGASVEAPSLVDTWNDMPNAPGLLPAALRRHAMIRLSKARVAGDDLDDVLYGQCVARRVWTRLHAWELVESRIPAHELLVAVNAAIEKARTAAGVSRRSPLPEVDSRRTDNTIGIVHVIRSELGTTDPVRIAAEYRTRYSTLRFDRRLLDAGGIVTPRHLERLLDSGSGQA